MKRLSVWLTAALVLLCGCAVASEMAPLESQGYSAPPQKKKAAYRYSVAFTGSSYLKKFEQVAANILRRTDGNFELVLFSDNQMGTNSEVIRAVQKGTLSLTATSTSIFQPYVPKAAVTSIPACYTQYVQPYVYYDGEFFNQLNRYFREAGFELLVQESSGYRLLTSAEPITTLAQLKDIRIRTLNNRFHARLWGLLGATPFENIEWRELYYALEEGVVEAQENPLEVIRMGRIQDIHPYALNGPFFVTYNSVVMNKETYDALPDQYQQILKEELENVMKESTVRGRSNPTEIFGLTMNTLSQEDQEQLQAILQPMLREIEEEAGTELMDALLLENRLKQLTQ